MVYLWRAFRKKEAESGNQSYIYAQNLIKVVNEIKDEDAEPAKKKQKTSNDEAEQQQNVVDLSFIDEWIGWC